MIYTDLTKKALDICFKAHKRQLDRGGMPYVFHPYHLAELCTNETECCVALLHDVVEDGSLTIEELQESFPLEITEAVSLLTRAKGEPYFAYIFKIKRSGNTIAIKVKIMDLQHNLDTTRLEFFNDAVHRRLGKYKQALDILCGDDYGNTDN